MTNYMKIKIIDQSGDRFVVERPDGSIHTYPTTPYWYVKLVMFQGDRIIYNVTPRNEIVETFENKIFNVKGYNIRGKKGQSVIYTKFDMADEIGKVITNDTDEVPNKEGFRRLFDVFHDKIDGGFDVEYLESLLRQNEGRVVITKEGFIIDDRFIVVRDGNAHLWNGGKGKFLCIHPHNQGSVKDMVINVGGEDKKFSAHSQILLSKISYLLDPTGDCPHSQPGKSYSTGTTCYKDRMCTVFTNQLPATLKKQLEQEFESKNKHEKKKLLS